ncbi:carbonic anhydrase [Lipingzhangella sp. LS1_29]|uniref:carbonic anhydrase n=1 Tax=Lipingzhangella rawalii TaxID=2055835 RepID=A0ABU2H765_9ACTN|nr:carbonic anhydrase [Lipingzhangella rawalii]MDS1271154.1 carbonic anhydrase [Lipingzhangella rawalii]
MSIDELLAVNERYLAQFRHGAVPAGTSRGLAVSIVGHPAVDPHRAFGLALGDALLPRSTEPRVTAALRGDLAVAQHLGARQALHVLSTDAPNAPETTETLRADLETLRADPQLFGLDVHVGSYDVTTGRLELVTGVPAESEISAVLAANERYVAQFQPPVDVARGSRHLSVVTCMDSRINPEELLNVDLGTVTVRRNAGAHVTDEVLDGLAGDVAAHGAVDLLVLVHEDCKARPDREERLAGARADGSAAARDPRIGERAEVITGSYDVHTGRLTDLRPAHR